MASNDLLPQEGNTIINSYQIQLGFVQKGTEVINTHTNTLYDF